MHEDVINHCVPAGSKKGGKRTGFAVLLLKLKKRGRVRHWTWGCNSFKRGCEVFESSYTSISHHFPFDVLWPLFKILALRFKSLSSLAGFGPEPVSSRRRSVPTSLMEQVGAYDLNSFPALNVLARQRDRSERESQRTHLMAPSSEFMTF